MQNDDAKRFNVEHYALAAGHYDSVHEHSIRRAVNTDRKAKVIQELSLETDGGDFLDYGCGTGFLMEIAEKYFQHVAGVDVSPDMIAQISDERLRACARVGDEHYLKGLPGGSFSAICCNSVLHHIPEHDELLREFFRLLKPAGIFHSFHDPNAFHRRSVYYRLRGVARRVLRPGSTHALSGELEEKAEVYDMAKGGMNPEKIKAKLLALGFEDVTVYYDVPNRYMRKAVRLLALDPKYLAYHFAIKAYKAGRRGET